jgi:hypothetical protein
MIWVSKAKYESDYRVHIEFNDGRTGIVDLGDTILNDQRRIFRPLRDPDYFKRFKVAMDTLVWENEADFAPEFLYEHLQETVPG